MEEALKAFLCCPVCKGEKLVDEHDVFSCQSCGRQYPVVQGRPILSRQIHANPGGKSSEAGILIAAARQLRPRDGVPQWECDPTADSLEDFYFDKLFPKFNRADPHWSFLGRKVAEMANLVPNGSRILDIGAGECKYGAFFQSSHYVGTDLVFSSEQHDFSRIDVVAEASELPFCNASFDVALNLVVMEHVPDPIGTVREMARILKPNGSVFSLIPLVRPEHLAPYDFQRFTRFGIKQLFEKNGFRITSIEASNGSLWTAVHYLSVIAKTTPLVKFGRRSLRGILVNRFWHFILFPLLYYARRTNSRYESNFPIYYWVRASKT